MNTVDMDLHAVLNAVIAAVEREGRLLLEEFTRAQGPRGRHATAPVDTEIEERLHAVLVALVPAAFVGEETEPAPGTLAGWTWLVDPHDGTRQFLQARRGSAISVGLVCDGVAVLGVVHCPNAPDIGSDTVAWAEGCGPVLRNGEPVRARFTGRSLGAREIVWATASAAERPATYARAAAPARFVAMPSIAYRLARAAGGDGVAAVSLHSVSEYDIAAGAALVRGAGGVVLDAAGSPIVFTGLPGARVSACFAGAGEAALALARFDWSALEREPKRPPRVQTGFPVLADEARRARAQGCLLGQVIGDSLGSLVEFRPAAEIVQAFPGGVRELADGGAWGAMAGQPTDDSELAIALGRALLREHGFDVHAVRLAYRHWLASGPFDISAATRRGLADEPDQASESNGSLMRVSPIGVWAAGRPSLAAGAARDDSRLTHPNAVCVEACAAYCAAVAAGVGGGSRQAMIAAALDAAAPQVPAVRAAIERAVGGERPADFQTRQDWVLIALQEAFFQLAHAAGFEEGLVATVGAGGDADTNGAIAGALMGALHGSRALPRRWILPVLSCRPAAEADAFRPRPMDYWPDDILELAEALAKLAP
jgi:ADP-ribosyl-[dinitrogen reductase] hydrolase